MLPSSTLILPALSLALVCDALIGDPGWLYRRVPHPVVLMGRLIGALDARFNRETASAEARIVAGALATLAVVVLSGAIGMILAAAVRPLAFGWVIEGVLMSALIAQRSLFEHVRDVAEALRRDGPETARIAVARIVGRETSALDEGGIARGAIESLAENFSDGVAAPVFWGAIFGLPGLLAYKALNTADSMIGHRTARHLHFGRVAARLDDLANFIPARLAAIIICLAASISAGAEVRRAFRTMAADAGRHRSANAGYPEAAMAGALGVRLSGPRRYAGLAVEEPWIGRHLRDANRDDIQRGLTVFVCACVILFALVAGAAGVSMAQPPA